MFLSSSSIQERLDDDDQLVKLNKLIDWNSIGKQLHFLHNRMGRDRYSSLQMFKALLLGQWHSLSDPGLERS